MQSSIQSSTQSSTTTRAGLHPVTELVTVAGERPARRHHHDHERGATVSVLSPEAAHDLRVVIADADTLLRAGLASLLHAHGFNVAAVAGDPATLLEQVRAHHPDLVLVDVRMPETDVGALDAAVAIRQEMPDVGIMVLSAHVEVEQAAALFGSGRGIGYLLKSRVDDVGEFVDSLRRVARGGSVVDPAVVQRLIRVTGQDDPLASLSPRELDVLALMAEGRSNLGIAQELWLAQGTVEKHVHRILAKLELDDTPVDHRRVLAVVAYLRSR